MGSRITRFKTETGSIYEIDTEGKKLRREVGVTPVQRLNAEGSWKEYEDISPITVGKRVIVQWKRSDTPLLEGSPNELEPCTITSRVVSILDNLN